MSAAARPPLRIADPLADAPRGRFPRLERLWKRLIHDAIRATVPPTARVFIGLFAIGWSVMTVSFWKAQPFEVLVPAVWPIWYVVTAVTCWAFFARPASHYAYVLSGTFASVGILARALAVLASVLYDSDNLGANIYRTPWYAAIEVVVWTLFAASVLFVWHVGFAA